MRIATTDPESPVYSTRLRTRKPRSAGLLDQLESKVAGSPDRTPVPQGRGNCPGHALRSVRHLLVRRHHWYGAPIGVITPAVRQANPVEDRDTS